MGIKNNLFHLILLDPDLADIDPHNLVDNSEELKLKIVREAKTNPYYIFRELLRIHEIGTDGVRFKVNRGNLSIIWLYFNHIDNLVIAPRQTLKTVTATSIIISVMYFLSYNYRFSILAKGNKLRKVNIIRLKDMRDGLPKWLVHSSANDINNSEEITYDALSNTCDSYVAQNSNSGADSLGRGMTTPSQFWDEIAYFNNIDITYPIAIASTGTAVDNARKNHDPYGNILATTAGKLNSTEGAYTHAMILDSFAFTEHLYDLDDEAKLNATVASGSSAKMIYSEFSYQQLGYDDAWFNEKAARSKGTKDTIARDYLNKWTRGSETSPIDILLLDKVHSSKKEPVYVQYIDEFMIRWYIPKEQVEIQANFVRIPIVLGMDVSENVGNDNTSFVFVDARSLEVIGVCICNTVNLIKVALLVVKLLKNPNILYIPERNMAVGVIDLVLLELDKEGINPFKRIYNLVVQDHADNKFKNVNIAHGELYDKYRKYFGFRNSNSATIGRKFLYNTVFKRALELSADKINDAGLVLEIQGLTIRNGRVDHTSSGHDDRVVGYILACMVVLFGKNLSMYDAFSDMRKDTILQDIIAEENIENGVDIDDLQLRIQVLDKRLSIQKDRTKRVGIIHKLNDLKSLLPDDANNMIKRVDTVDDLVNTKANINVYPDIDINAYFTNI
jgi:hypothetical protein